MLSLPSRGKALIPNYVFVPTDLTPEEASNLPVVLDFHGGGFYLGSTLEQAPFCAMMARELRCVVITVDYRLGPIDKYPAAIEDAEDVLRSILDESFKGYNMLREAVTAKVKESYKHTDGTVEIPMKVRLDRQRITISGFSSGGNLALNMALSINKTESNPAWASVIPDDFPAKVPLLLFYPSFDSRQLPSERACPMGLHMPAGFWAEVNDILAPSYLPRARSGEPRASPGLADLEGLHEKARMLLVLPGLDSLAEQSETWAKKVQDGGRGDDLKIERFPTMKHGWTQMPESWLNEEQKRTRREIFDKTVAFTRDIWAGKETSEAGEPKHLAAVP